MNLVLGSRLPFYLLFAMENELFRDSTIKNRKIRAALDAQIDGFESMINFYMCPRLFDILNVVMVTVWFTSAEICFLIWLLKNSCERPVWYHGNGFHWCFVRSCPELTPSKFREYWEHWWFRGRKNRIYDNYHSCLCSHIPGDMSHKTQACNRATQFSLTNLKARCQIHKFEWQAWRIVQRSTLSDMGCDIGLWNMAPRSRDLGNATMSHHVGIRRVHQQARSRNIVAQRWKIRSIEC